MKGVFYKNNPKSLFFLFFSSICLFISSLKKSRFKKNSSKLTLLIMLLFKLLSIYAKLYVLKDKLSLILCPKNILI